MENIKLTYVCDGEIRTKQYVDTVKADNDWAIILRHKVPCMKFRQGDDLEWHLEESHGLTGKWAPIPGNRLPSDVIRDVQVLKKEDQDYLGCRFDYCEEQRLLFATHVFMTEYGMKIIDSRLIDSHGHRLEWIKYD